MSSPFGAGLMKARSGAAASKPGIYQSSLTLLVHLIRHPKGPKLQFESEVYISPKLATTVQVSTWAKFNKISYEVLARIQNFKIWLMGVSEKSAKWPNMT